jgi:hypothetical protein
LTAQGQELADSAAGQASVTSVRSGSRRFGERHAAEFGWGPKGRWFKSSRPDRKKPP